MSKPDLVRLLFAGLAIAAAPAQAKLSVHYDGHAIVQFETSTGHIEPGAMTGPITYRASFYYDDAGNQLAATLRVNDIVSEHFTMCPAGITGYCPPLALTATSIRSGTGTTPEAYITSSVYSPGGFGGMPLPAATTRTYTLVPGDDSLTNLSWYLFDNSTGYAWNSGSGTVDSVTTGVPEPESWMLIITGLGLTGLMLRRERSPATA